MAEVLVRQRNDGMVTFITMLDCVRNRNSIRLRTFLKVITTAKEVEICFRLRNGSEFTTSVSHLCRYRHRLAR